MSHHEWAHDGRRILLPILLLRPTPASDLTSIAADALVDTGAVVSGISKNLATSLGLTGRGKRQLLTAQGIGYAERYPFRIALPSEIKTELPFVFDEVMGFEIVQGATFDALIGMDILKQCDFRILRDGRCEIATGRHSL